ncbi:MAG: type II toxin-antitoxin system HigB family toxin [Dongiaceae bacterium]
MRIVARSTLVKFWTSHADAKTPLEAWYRACHKADWSGPADLKIAFGARVDFLPRNRVIFDIGGNNYRLIAVILYRRKTMYIRFIGTHAEYDRIDPATV